MKLFFYFLSVVIISFVFTVVIINWIDDNESEVSVKFVDGKVSLNIEVGENDTCESMKQQLDLKPITVKGKTYSPTCGKIDDNIIRIVYTQDIAI